MDSSNWWCEAVVNTKKMRCPSTTIKQLSHQTHSESGPVYMSLHVHHFICMRIHKIQLIQFGQWTICLMIDKLTKATHWMARLWFIIPKKFSYDECIKHECCSTGSTKERNKKLFQKISKLIKKEKKNK